jgi:pSer/pThr/pTyr-binding forkhead associated (FHA) protein/soluble lytic murein transglycosylase-like protein
MTIRLVHRTGSLEGRRDQFDEKIVRLGRKPDNDVVFQDKVVSSYHAEIRFSGGRYTLVDLDSTNGTFLNGRRIHREPLDDRDSVQLGEDGPVFEVRVEATGKGDIPSIVPLTGEWEGGREPIPLDRETIRLGRGQDNDVVVGRVPGSPVSAHHAEIRMRAGVCEIEDLDSTNGTFVNGERIRATRLEHGDRVQLGEGGPTFEFRHKGGARRRKPGHSSESDKILRKLEHAARGGAAGERTMLFLQAAQKYYKRRRWPLLVLLGVLLVAAAAISVELYRKNRELQQMKRLAEEVFYQMRLVDAKLVGQRESMSREQLQDLSNERARAQKLYDEYLEKLGAYRGKSEVEKAIMRLARDLGETDFQVPPDFQKAVLSYVEKWRATPRLRTALERARTRGLLKVIREALDQYSLPRDLLFIALEESDFDARQVGPETRLGFAKGMWQFVPATAVEYGLTLGPLKHLRQYDPSDQRHDEFRSTHAAARYLAYLYSSKAAASGLLVIASYNYGQTRIIEKLDQLPNDPRQRNFWNFYRNGWLPDETRNYVMDIFSVALICQKPHLFNFAMEPVSALW